MDEILRYDHCFVCGVKNRHGLKARFYYDGRQAVTEIIAEQDFEGYRGIYHGGIIATLLDETMIKSILAEDIYAVTVEMTVRFLKPVEIKDKLRISGRVVSRKGRLYRTEGEVVNGEGAVCASAIGKYIRAKPKLEARLQRSLD